MERRIANYTATTIISHAAPTCGAVRSSKSSKRGRSKQSVAATPLRTIVMTREGQLDHDRHYPHRPDLWTAPR